MVEQSPKILVSEEKATTTISMMVHHHLSVYHVKVLNGIFKGKATVAYRAETFGGRMFHDKLALSSFPDTFPHYV